ncbi:hypothetical protein CNAG_05436 [Cryptococcus neoformans var. grubii H99]|uniref:DDE-1 domain-containing protein n=1 Tax=Cryptococcus neoformans (strain H99 / ATCC 208821 / CBS 10515 / FGSC 9487) TaxID=235443 RepID=J9W1I2_CRYN9|nr:hypothetical protein CNAG_05436 [Cryptococcus neoformans var. grubii H99]AFR98864.1 hypothetical protein CNAG_05436 [Cryptococcus neoformans var. grubii H99]AUB29074.1 hypothetical protein CKF44_05436 [Cryptococcus neoformans var. grubii]|eukprot:XP_012053769.1 hypothetical protein CNAG_05436 [Cryptococcus neoformans var. grubii H99]
MADSMTLALEHKINKPLEGYQKVADLYGVSKSSLYDRHTGVHSSHTASAPRHLSIVQEEELVKRINEYAERGTLLTPRHVVELAEAVYDGKLGVNWGSWFIQRHCDTIHSRFFSYQELGHLHADIPETRRAFYHLVKDVYDTGLYAPHLIFNMDEVAFELSSSRRVRRVAPRTHPKNGQAVPPSNEHITSVACIGIDSAPVPPLIIYQGAQLQESWFKVGEKGDGAVRQLAINTDSGWINSYVMLKWLEDAFDPYTRDIASGGRERRLLILDGAEPHTKVDFLEACWARNIVVILLPAKMSGRFQPLDVDFFNTLKAAYHRQLDEYQLGSSLRGVAKGMFWGWHQRAWRETATSRQIRGAWRKSGLFPLDPAVMGIEEQAPATPPPQAATEDLLTPRNLRILRANSRAVRQGKVAPFSAMLKLEKASEQLIARNALLEDELARVKAT